MNDNFEYKGFIFRKVDCKSDKDDVIEIECQIMYANERYLSKLHDYQSYRERWFASGRPERVIADIKKSLQDERTICGFLETPAGEKAAFFSLTFSNVEGFDHLIAMLEDIYVYEKYRKKGIGSLIMKYLEEKAKKAGAQLFCSGTSFFNTASKNLHEKNGFYVYRNCYEKRL